MSPPASASARVGEPVEVDVEQRQAAGVLGHEDEGRRVDRVGHAEARAEALRELRLAGAELAPQAERSPGSAAAARRAASRRVVGRGRRW